MADDGMIEAKNAPTRAPGEGYAPPPPSQPLHVNGDFERDARRALARKNILIGALLLGGGLVLTIATWSAASSGGGTYVLAWGPIIFGGIRLVRGLSQAQR